MTSQKRIDANRVNATRSTGPKTRHGKKLSSQNATRHGLLAKAIVLPGESEDGFQALHDAYSRRVEPTDEIELSLVEEMAAANWRTRRLYVIQRKLMEKEILGPPEVPTPFDRIVESFENLSGAGTPKLSLAQRYETQHHVNHARCLRQLILLRTKLPPPVGTPSKPRRKPPAQASNPSSPDSPIYETNPPNSPVSNTPIPAESAVPAPLSPPADPAPVPQPSKPTPSGPSTQPPTFSDSRALLTPDSWLLTPVPQLLTPAPLDTTPSRFCNQPNTSPLTPTPHMEI